MLTLIGNLLAVGAVAIAVAALYGRHDGHVRQLRIFSKDYRDLKHAPRWIIRAGIVAILALLASQFTIMAIPIAAWATGLFAIPFQLNVNMAMNRKWFYLAEEGNWWDGQLCRWGRGDPRRGTIRGFSLLGAISLIGLVASFLISN